MRAGDRRRWQGREPAVEVVAVEVNEVGASRAQDGREPLPECATLVLVVRVRLVAHEGPHVVPDLTDERFLVGDGGRLGDRGDDLLQRAPSRLARGPIGLVVQPGEGDEVDVILEPQLPQHIERTVRDPAVGRVGERLGQHEHARPSGHTTFRRAVFARPMVIATSVYSMSVYASDRKNAPTTNPTSAAIRL